MSDDSTDAEGYRFFASEAEAWAELTFHASTDRDPRTGKLLDYRHHGCTNCRCDWCKPAKKAGFKAKMKRAWKALEDI